MIFLLKAPTDWSNAVTWPFCVVVRSYQIPKHAILKKVAKAYLLSMHATLAKQRHRMKIDCTEQTHVGVSKIFHQFKVYFAQTSALCRSCGIETGSLKTRIIYQYRTTTSHTPQVGTTPIFHTRQHHLHHAILPLPFFPIIQGPKSPVPDSNT